MTLCEMTAGRTSPAQLMGREGQSGSKLPAARTGGFGGRAGAGGGGGGQIKGEIGRQYHQLTFA